MEEKKFARQIALFGIEGQKAIQSTKVALVGCGGLGSHLAQQLAYLGVQDFVVVDDDRVEATNLNRLIGATDKDIGELKTEVIRRMILTISPASTVRIFPDTVLREEALEMLKAADILFGSVDDDSVRLFLTHYTSVLGMPYMDLSSEIIEDGEEFGGRIMFSLGGESCLMCMNELDQEEIRRGFLSDEEKEIDKRLYGVNHDLLEGSGPSVVSLNGTIASLAVNEFFVWRTGLRPPKRLFKYYGSKSEIRHSRDLPMENCYYCKGIYGLKGLDQIRDSYPGIVRK